MNAKKLIGTALSVVLCASMLAGCGNQKNETETTTEKGKKTLVIGDTTFNSSNEENNVNPHDAYSGWACIRYGIGETLVKYSDTMEIEPWLAKEWENVDELTWKITLQDNVKFSSGRDMDAEAVKECLEHLTENHERAKNDLKIDSMEADGQILTIHTSEPKPALLNYLGDPYGCIIDVDAGFDDGIVAGTGPYIAVDCQSDDHLTLVKNEDYWNGTPKIDELTIRTITDGSTLANALQSGEIQAAYGMAYESYPLFENDAYTFSQISTSRCFFGKMNFDESSVCADPAVRKAIAMGIDKENFVATLLEGNGYVANGVFPEGSAFGGDKVITLSNPENPGQPGQSLKVHIPAGIDNGKSIRLRGKGMPGTGGGEAGDLLLKVTVAPKPGYERKGMDVYTTVSVPYTTAVFGGEALVHTLYGDVLCKIKEGTQSGSKIRLRGKGIVSMKDSSVHGDQYVTIQIEVPRNLSPQARQKLKEFEEICQGSSRTA